MAREPRPLGSYLWNTGKDIGAAAYQEGSKAVADIGAGSGWFTVRAARRVTGTGTVYAVDINPEALQYIDRRLQKEQLHNVKQIN